MIVRMTRKRKSFISLSTTNEGKRKKGNTKKTERTQWQRGKEKKFETPFFLSLYKDKPKKIIIIYLLSQLNLLPFHSYIRSHIYIYISHSPPHLLYIKFITIILFILHFLIGQTELFHLSYLIFFCKFVNATNKYRFNK